VTTLQRVPDTSMRMKIIYISIQGKSIGEKKETNVNKKKIWNFIYGNQ
jgi:hypothetical protein